MTVAESGLSSLNISWAFEFIEGVQVDFELTAMNLVTSNSEVRVTRNQHLIFTALGNASCDTYSFQVRAMADSGNSEPSEESAPVSIPSLPDISLVENSLNHSLVKTSDGEFVLTIALQV